jgi:two-component system response regulator RegX3
MVEAVRPRVLVVEDETSIRQGLIDVLAFHGYEPEGEERGDEGLARALRGSYALVVLDLMLPGMNGFDVCEKLRAAQPKLPILILTARGAEEDVLRGFRSGGDDYVTKPFSIAELMARVESLLRRSGALQEQPAAEPFAFGAWTVDPVELHARNGDETLTLTRRDADLLALFFRETGRLVSRRRLLRELWGYDDPDRIETRSVDMHIAKLRKKLGARGSDLIETVRGEGYRFTG